MPSLKYVRWAFIAGIVSLCLFTYGEVIHYYFTDVDTFSLINDGRYQSLTQFFERFSSELMSGRMINAVYYRPVTSLTLGTLHKISGLNPMGYHIADLGLFIAATLLVFALAQSLWAGARGAIIGGLAAVVFILHPLQVDTVAANARIGDMLMVFFALASIVCFARYFFADENRTHTGIFYWASVLFCLLCVCSKEPGVIVPGVIGLLAFLFNRRETIFQRMKHTVLLLMPFFICVGVYFYFRSMVIGGMGGYVTQSGSFDDTTFSTLRIKVAILGHITGFFLPILNPDFDRWVLFFFNRTTLLMTLGVVLLVFILVALFPHVKRLVKAPVSHDPILEDQRRVIFLIGFLGLHTALLFRTFFSFRYLYFALAPFAILIGFAVVRFFEQGFYRTHPRLWPKWKIPKVLGFIVLLVTMFAESPLWNRALLRHWYDGANVTRTVVTQLARITESQPQTPVYLLNIPYALNYGQVSPVLWELPFNQMLMEHAMVDYLDLVEYETSKAHSPILVLNYSFLTEHPSKTKITSRFVDPHTIEVTAHTGAVPARFPWTEIPGRNDRSHLFSLEGGRIPFEPVPDEGWSKTMRVKLTDLALQEPAPQVFAFDGRSLTQDGLLPGKHQIAFKISGR